MENLKARRRSTVSFGIKKRSCPDCWTKGKERDRATQEAKQFGTLGF